MICKWSIGLGILIFYSGRAFADPSAFVFQNQLTCQGSFCTQYEQVTKPHAWKDDEKSRVTALILKLEKNLPAFMAKVESTAPVGIHRLTQGAQWDKKTQGFIGFPYFGDADATSGMDLTDITFLEDKGIEQVFGATILEHVFVHELGHLYDFASKDISSQSPFADLTHWILGNSGGQIYSAGLSIPGYDADAITAANEQMRDLIGQGKILASGELTHKYGIKFGYPSSYAMSNNLEDFAESVSWIYYDSKAPTYLSADVVQYFRSQILK